MGEELQLAELQQEALPQGPLQQEQVLPKQLQPEQLQQEQLQQEQLQPELLQLELQQQQQQPQHNYYVLLGNSGLDLTIHCAQVGHSTLHLVVAGYYTEELSRWSDVKNQIQCTSKSKHWITFAQAHSVGFNVM